jgi:two-component system, LytTR family, response regulator
MATSMKALIVDDERRARNEMQRLLLPYPWIKVVGEASTVQEAMEQIELYDPDLLFLDIQMPQRDGFQLVQDLPSPPPKIIFTTAYDEFAIRAFDVNALDYLLKPIAPDRLKTALTRLEDISPTEAPDLPLRENDRVFMRDGDKCWFVSVNSIRLLESEGDYTRVYFDNHRPLISRTVTSLEQRLPADLFFRANRRQILNLGFIASVSPWFSSGLKVKLHGGEEIEVSRRSAKSFRQKMSL